MTWRVRIRRSPLRSRALLWGLPAGLAIVAASTALGWAVAAAHPVALDTALQTTSPPPGWVRVAGQGLGYLGHAWLATPVAVGLAVASRLRWGTWDLGWLLLVVLGGTAALIGLTKLLTDRARPDGALVGTFTSAFPSGHAARAVAACGLVVWLVLRLSRRPAVRGAVVLLAVALIAASGAARVALDVHWATDVLVGYAIGAAWLGCVFGILRPTVAPDEAGTRAPWRPLRR